MTYKLHMFQLLQKDCNSFGGIRLKSKIPCENKGSVWRRNIQSEWSICWSSCQLLHVLKKTVSQRDHPKAILRCWVYWATVYWILVSFPRSEYISSMFPFTLLCILLESYCMLLKMMSFGWLIYPLSLPRCIESIASKLYFLTKYQ